MSNVEATAEDLATPSAGRVLKAERERRGLSEKDAADALRITMHYLRSVEADRYDKLPGAVFAKGYVRSYAQLLELNVDDIVSLYELSSSPQPEVARERTRTTFIQRMPRSSQATRSFPWLLASLIAFVVGFISVWAYSRYFASADELGGYSSVNQLPHLASDEVAPPQSSGVQVAATILRPAITAANSAPAAATTVTASAPQILAPAPQNSVAPVEPAVTAPVSNEDGRIIAVTHPGNDVLQIRFSGECWIEVSDGGTSSPVYRDIREAGDVLQITGAAPFNVLLGDAPYATVEFNGEVLDMSNQIRIDNSARLTVGL
ncbi:MAG: hypothetical protein RLZZ385_678 [Pseudomonadota bacterium]